MRLGNSVGHPKSLEQGCFSPTDGFKFQTQLIRLVRVGGCAFEQGLADCALRGTHQRQLQVTGRTCRQLYLPGRPQCFASDLCSLLGSLELSTQGFSILLQLVMIILYLSFG